MLHHKVRLISDHENTIKTMVMVLLAIGILGRILNVGVYPPVGGINVYLWGLGVALLMTGACHAVTILDTRRVSVLFTRFAPVVSILAVSSLLALWAAAVHTFTDTLSPTRLLTFILGIGLVTAVWFGADSAFRMRLLLGAVIVGTGISALYSGAITMFGDPFMTIWVILSKVSLESVRSVVGGGRMAGLSSHINAFSYILAAAAPLAFGFLVIGGRLHTRSRTWSLSASLYVVLVLMLTVLLLNATRSAILGAAVGCMVTGAILLVGRPDLWKRVAAVLALIAAWLLLMFVPGVRGAEAILASGPMPSDKSEAEGVEDAWFGRALVRVSQPGWPSDKDSPYEVKLREKIDTARELWRESRADFGLNRRIVSLGDVSARARIPMALTALRYSFEFPFGTGRYFPEERHLPAGLEPRLAEEVLTHLPHNQFLIVLVYYGYPGLVLLIAFYLLIGRSLLITARHFLRSRDTESLLLAAAVTGALAGYGLNSMFHNAGPFDTDWSYFIIVGVVFSIERLAAERASQSRVPGCGRDSTRQRSFGPSPQGEMRSG